jgi:hypothetical protein
MNKKHIITSLNKKKRGVYDMIVKIYDEVIESMPLIIAHDFIEEELGKESGTKIKLNYFSFAHAVYRLKKKRLTKTVNPNSHVNLPQKWNFRDSHEIPNDHPRAGTFKENK